MRRVLTALVLAPVRFYRRWLSPLKRTPTCRYLPTCSEYAIEAVQVHGPVVGTGMAVSRVLRCNPLFFGGYHPVAHKASACCEAAAFSVEPNRDLGSMKETAHG